MALANLDQQITQNRDDAALLPTLLLRAQMVADYGALDRAAAITEHDASSAEALLQRAQARAALHRFGDALRDLAEAEQAGAPQRKVMPQRAAVLVATGQAQEALPWLQAEAARHPGFATHVALAHAYAALGRLEDADALYAGGLRQLDTTLPFPAAAVWFWRGRMWSEQGADPRKGEAMYREALRCLPQHVAANVHLAELEAQRGELEPAIERLQRVTALADEPEALALLGQLHLRTGQAQRGREEIERARQRYEALLARHPMAFADHAAEFFLGAGEDPAKALAWARMNLLVRPTRRAHALALRGAQAMGQHEEARALEARMRERFASRAA